MRPPHGTRTSFQAALAPVCEPVCRSPLRTRFSTPSFGRPRVLAARGLQLDLAVNASRQSLVPKVLECGHEGPQQAEHLFQMRSPLRACVRRRSRFGCACHSRRLCCLCWLLDAVVLRMPEMTPTKTHKRTSIPSFANLRMPKS